jgi:general secretion pathway protein G
MRRNRVSKAFTLVEILIVVVILGILAAIVIPQFTNASQEAQVGNAQTQLQTIRSQIELFRVRYNGQAPVLVGDIDASFNDLLAGKGNTLGLNDWNSFGTAATPQEPYARTRPINPRTGTNSVVESADPIADAQAFVQNGDTGWLYNSTTGQLAANGFDEVPGSANYGKWVPAAP